MNNLFRFPSRPCIGTWATVITTAAVTVSNPAHAAPVDMGAASSYSQNFDTLANTGTTNAWTDDGTIASWYSQRTGTGTTYAVNTGSSTGGGLYSFGSTSSTERALGTIGSSNAAAGHFAHGVLLRNTTGGTLTIDSLAYVGEQWRKSGDTAAQTVTLWYQVSSGAISALTPSASTNVDTGWTAVTGGDFSSPVNTATAASLDGNLAANRSAISVNPGISVPAGNYVMIRWKDPDHTGTDHGLAIDDVAISWSASSQPALTLGAVPATFVENAGSTASTGTVSIPAALGADLVVSLASSDATEATVPATVTIPQGQTSATFAIAAVDDLFADGSQAVTITATAAGYVSAQTGVTVENDSDLPIAVSVLPNTFAENAGNGAATGTVTLAANTVADLTVHLNSNDTTEATVPASVTILAGTNSATFAVDAVDDADVDGTRNVTIQASATGYSSGSATVQVTDYGDTAPPPTLSPGAIAFTGFNADGNDDLAFVALAPIAETDYILLTDNAWNGQPIGSGGAITGTEGVIKWQAPAGGVAQGTVITLNSLSNTGRSASAGTVTAVTGSFNLGSSGDTVYAYQGATFTPTGFIALIDTSGSATTTNTGLSPEHGIFLPVNCDIAAYTASRSSQSTYPGYLTPLTDTINNWISQDAGGDQSIDTIAPDLPFDTTAFTLSAGNTYDSWKSVVGGQTADQDFDGDGLDNGTEYFMGTAGDVFTANPGVVAGTVVWPRASGTTVTAWRVEVSADLTNWTDATVTYPGSVDTTTNPAEVRFSLPGGPTKLFVRLMVQP